ncbi:MAG: VWA domain-containing protein [Acidobacteriota bacterium]|nr:VWA domain-containing protein [Acidobacteriota bacterium]
MFKRTGTALFSFSVLLFAAGMHAQQKLPNANGQDSQVAPDPAKPFTLSVSTQLVLRTVTVRDKKGDLVENLTASDFLLTEDGKVQRIRICDLQKLGKPNVDLPGTPLNGEGVKTVPGTPPPRTGNRYNDHRLLILYFDMTSMPMSDQLRALSSAQTFIEQKMTPDDLVSILTYSGGGIRDERDFTSDHAALLATIHSLTVGEGQGLSGNAHDASAADTGAPFGQDDTEFNLFNSDRQLAALQNVITRFGNIRQKKSLLYFSSGMRLNGLDNQAQLQSTINSAVRADVAIWPIDTRGLLGAAPIGDATAASPGTLAMYTGAAATAVTTNFDRSQDTFRTLAADTGGKALLNYNDLSRGIVRAQQSVSSYYIIGYYTSNAAADGHYRRVNISLANHMSANLDYSPGYYAKKEFKEFTAADKERQLEEALALNDPETDIPIALELNYFRINQAEYFVPLAVKIPGSELALAKRKGADRTVIDFIAEVKDEFHVTVANLRDKADIVLSGPLASELAMHPISYQAGLTLLPGKYSLKFLARDSVSGRIGTYQTQFQIPNLSRNLEIPISSVVIGNQKTAVKYLLFSSKKGSGDRDNPLFDGRDKLVPSVNRVFSSHKPIYVYLQAYQPPNDTDQLVAAVTIVDRQGQVFSSGFQQPQQRSRHGMTTDEFLIDVTVPDLPPGQYTCQVGLFSPTRRQVVFRQIPIAIQR